MKKAFKNYRYYVLAALAIIAVIGILAVPNETLPLRLWFTVLICTKIVGLSAGYLAVVLYIYWRRQGTITSPNQAVKNYIESLDRTKI